MEKRIKLLVGIFIIVFLAVSYFIKINIEEGSNYMIEDNLLGILIFHNPFILALYLFIAIILVLKAEL